MAANYGFSPPGFLVRQEVAGATQFNGTTDQGLVTFAGVAGKDYGAAAVSPQSIPLIYTIGYEALETAGTPHRVDFYIVRVGGSGGSQRYRIGGSRILDDGTFSLTFAATLSCCGGLPVPRNEIGTAQNYYQLQVFTTGKDTNATLTVHYGMGVPGA